MELNQKAKDFLKNIETIGIECAFDLERFIDLMAPIIKEYSLDDEEIRNRLFYFAMCLQICASVAMLIGERDEKVVCAENVEEHYKSIILFDVVSATNSTINDIFKEKNTRNAEND